MNPTLIMVANPNGTSTNRTLTLSAGLRLNYADKFDGRSIRRRQERAARKDAKKAGRK